MDNGASLHMMCKNEITSGDTVRRSKDPTVIMTANGKAECTEGVTVYVTDLDVHNDAVGSWWGFCVKKWATPTNGKTRVAILDYRRTIDKVQV